MRMIRKQLYIDQRQQQKLTKLAARWGCTEAEVVRSALDRMPDPDASVVERLADAGLLVPPPADYVLTEEELGSLEHDVEAWLVARAEPLGLAQAVLEDRR